MKTDAEITQSSSFVVPSPSGRPDYTLHESATITEMRQMAVQAMRDMLTIQFSLDQNIKYNKTGAVSHKDYIYKKDTVYGGLPYADGQTNIFVWHEFYNANTGRLRLDGDGQWLNDVLGNTCAGSLMWAWSAVCHSLTGSFVNFNMTLKNGCLPLGSYTYNTEISSYREQTTKEICQINGTNTIFESYALVQIADALTYSIPPAGHTMMAIENAHVERLPDGSIDPQNSYIIIQDQTSGNGDGFYEFIENGTPVLYTGRLGHKCTFQFLYEKGYIPCTTAEFAGIQPYESASVAPRSGRNRCSSLDDLLGDSVLSNYPMCILKLQARSEQGNVANLLTVYFNRNDVGNGSARSFPLSTKEAEIREAVEALSTGDYTVSVEVTVSTGEVFTPIALSLQK